MLGSRKRLRLLKCYNLCQLKLPPQIYVKKLILPKGELLRVGGGMGNYLCIDEVDIGGSLCAS